MRKYARHVPFIGMLTLGLFGWVVVEQATAQLASGATQVGVVQKGKVTILNVNVQNQAAQGIDYVNAKAMQLPRAPSSVQAEAQEDLIDALMSQSSQAALGEPAYSPGGEGNGRMNLVRVGVPRASGEEDDSDGVSPQEHGTTNHPFSTARADLNPTLTNTSLPYAASGKLYFNVGTSTFLCSASLIKRGLVVTAAHCVANFGQNQFYTNWKFIPGYRNGSAPFGVWTAQTAIVLTSYFNGTDPCVATAPGIVCQNDIAVLRLNSQANIPFPEAAAFPGTATGWYGFGVNSFGFTTAGLTHITQLGYPVCLDNGALMQRNDSQGFKSASNVNNTVIGSLMCGGSSGGPWLINFGLRPTLTSTTNGTAPNPNLVVGVTSWGFISTAPKEQGASPFLSTNITVLVNAACGNPVSQPACL